jgi:hypothetical protein
VVVPRGGGRGCGIQLTPLKMRDEKPIRSNKDEGVEGGSAGRQGRISHRKVITAGTTLPLSGVRMSPALNQHANRQCNNSVLRTPPITHAQGPGAACTCNRGRLHPVCAPQAKKSGETRPIHYTHTHTQRKCAICVVRRFVQWLYACALLVLVLYPAPHLLARASAACFCFCFLLPPPPPPLKAPGSPGVAAGSCLLPAASVSVSIQCLSARAAARVASLVASSTLGSS